MEWNATVKLLMDEEQLENLLEQKKEAKERAKDSDFDKDYMFRTREIEYCSSKSVDENGKLNWSIETKNFGLIAIDNVEVSFKSLLNVVNYIHKRLGKAKTVMEGLK